ncbi:VIT1/CCC1 transporter family protein [Taibaiella koreensis]|uniref:VIT1/CCC1 transporter family protein n=1 Tax=Taibaiella koreensis TaxID=1268548 RepID=UPI000E59EB6E|nr:VIT1/CCC1 transporter family protein [Taibaiella koreensis]
MATGKRSSLFLVNVTTGMSDGMQLSFTVVVAAQLLTQSVAGTLYAGIGAALLGALAFGLARMLGEKEEINHHHPGLGIAEAEEELSLMHTIGIDPQLTADVKDKMAEEREQWLREIQEHGLGWETYDAGRARNSGLQTAGGFLCGGLLVSLCFAALCAIWPSAWPAYSVVWLLLFFTGWYKGRAMGKHPLRYALVQALSGMIVSLAVVAIMLLLLHRK